MCDLVRQSKGSDFVTHDYPIGDRLDACALLRQQPHYRQCTVLGDQLTNSHLEQIKALRCVTDLRTMHVKALVLCSVVICDGQHYVLAYAVNIGPRESL